MCNIFFAHSSQNIKPHIIIYYKILDFDNIVKFKTAVFPYKNLRKVFQLYFLTLSSQQ